MTAFRLAACPRCQRPGMARDEDGFTCMWCGRHVFDSGAPAQIPGSCFQCGGRSRSSTGFVCATHDRPDHVPTMFREKKVAV